MSASSVPAAVPLRPWPPEADPRPLDTLVALMAKLRSPEGCPWDRAQDLHSLLPYAVEEVHEVIEAVESGDPKRHRDELGDLLLQVVFQAQIRREEGAFDLDDVARALIGKLVRRHPHVFADAEARNPEEVRRAWDRIKAAERAAEPSRPLADQLPKGLPPLLAAVRIGERAARHGLDWPDAASVLDKVEEELAELRAAMALDDPKAVEEELGDLLFATASLARHAGIDPEAALRRSLRTFSARHARFEGAAQEEGVDPSTLSPEAVDSRWRRAKLGAP